MIAVVSDAIYPFNKGGKEIRYHHVVRRLPGVGYDVDVYTMRWWEGPAPSGPHGVRFRALCRRYPLYAGSRRSIAEAVLFSLACLRLLSEEFDAIEADHMPFLPLFPLWVVASVKRTPLIATWHEVWGATYWRQYLGRPGVVAAAVERLSTLLPDHIVAASPQTGNRLLEMGVPSSRLSVLPNGIDREAISAAAPDGDAPDVLFVGRLLPHKNVDVLIEAIALLRDGGRRVTCTVVGEGPERAELERIVARRGLAAQVRFLGAVEDNEAVFGLMKGSRVFALPSTREGFGITVLEALHCGIPVVTVDHPDNHARCLVDHGVTGRLSAAEPEDLASALAALLDGEQPETGRPEAGRPVVGGTTDWDGIVAALAAVYAAAMAVPR